MASPAADRESSTDRLGGVQRLQRADLGRVGAASGDAVGDRSGAAQCRDARDTLLHGGAADNFLVLEGMGAGRGVDDEVNLAVFDEVDDVGTPLVDLEHNRALEASRSQCGSCSASGIEGKAERGELLGDFLGRTRTG